MKISCVCQIISSNELKATKHFRNIPEVIKKSEWEECLTGKTVHDIKYDTPYISIDDIKPDLVCIIDTKTKTISKRLEVHAPDIIGQKYDNTFSDIIDMDRFIDNVFFGLDPSNDEEVKFIYDTSSKIMPFSMLISHLEGVKPEKKSAAETSIEFAEQLLKSLKMRIHNKCEHSINEDENNQLV